MTTSLDLILLKQLILNYFPTLQGLYLFGSYASETATPDSDLDLAILVPNLLSTTFLSDTAYLLAKKLQIPAVDLIDLKSASTILQKEIIDTGKRILTTDEMACGMYEVYIDNQALDFDLFRRDLVKDILIRGSVYG